MTYLLRKFLNKFITLQTTSNQNFCGEVLAITRNILTLKGFKFHNYEVTEIPKTYYIDISNIIWFKESCNYQESSLSSINKIKALETPQNKEKTDEFNDKLLEKSIDIIDDIEESTNIFEDLFENIETLIEIENGNDSETKQNPKVNIKFGTKYKNPDINS